MRASPCWGYHLAAVFGARRHYTLARCSAPRVDCSRCSPPLVNIAPRESTLALSEQPAMATGAVILFLVRFGPGLSYNLYIISYEIILTIYNNTWLQKLEEIIVEIY